MVDSIRGNIPLCLGSFDTLSFKTLVYPCSNPGYMYTNCAHSCDTCDGYKKLNLGVEQRTTGPSLDDWKEDILAHLEDTKDYMFGVVFQDPKYVNVRKSCQNRNPHCTFWAVVGRCEDDPDYMLRECAPACQSCIELDWNHRCPYDEADPTTVWGPGDLNHMFERITTDPMFLQYKPRILSKPSDDEGNDDEDGPWVVTLDNFLSDEEAEALIESGYDIGYVRSGVVGKVKSDGTFDSVSLAGGKRLLRKQHCLALA